MSQPGPTIGSVLREWRQRRRLSQLDFALEADISTRHLSYVETGKSRPSREMVLHLADRLHVPLRERNRMLVAAGFAPQFPERRLDDPALEAARRAVDLVLAGHEPYPAVAVDRHWSLVASNRAVAPLLHGVAPRLLAPPVNVMRLALDPDGLAPNIVNLAEWRAHLLHRLRMQVEATGDATVSALVEELRGPRPDRPHHDPHAGIVVPLRLRTEMGELSFISTITVFGTPLDITLSELAIETFLPADAATGEALRTRAAQG